MRTKELLEKYPLSFDEIKNWFYAYMLHSLEKDEVDDNFKKVMLAKTIDIDMISNLIDTQPRVLLDVFDDNNILIEIAYSNGFYYRINGIKSNAILFKTRREAEFAANEVAYFMLEDFLIKNIEVYEATRVQ